MDFFSNISPSIVLALGAKWPGEMVNRVWDGVGSICRCELPHSFEKK